jgi:hypothetical protein
VSAPTPPSSLRTSLLVFPVPVRLLAVRVRSSRCVPSVQLTLDSTSAALPLLVSVTESLVLETTKVSAPLLLLPTNVSMPVPPFRTSLPVLPVMTFAAELPVPSILAVPVSVRFSRCVPHGLPCFASHARISAQLGKGARRPPLHPPEQGCFPTPCTPGRRLCLCDTTRPFRLDLTRGGFRAPWTHDQEHPSWT